MPFSGLKTDVYEHRGTGGLKAQGRSPQAAAPLMRAAGPACVFTADDRSRWVTSEEVL